MNLISHPFRLAPNGQVATVEQGSDEAAAELIAALLLTHVGERPLAPGFGVTDMVGRGLDESELAAGIAMFGPDVTITDIDVETVSQDTQQVTVTFQ